MRYLGFVRAPSFLMEHVEASVLSDRWLRIAGLLAAEPDSAALLVTRRYVAEGSGTFEISANLYPANRYSVRTIIR